jgi:hypothetical protein
MEGLGLLAVLPSFLRDVEGRGDFVWRSPLREGTACTPESCPYATADNGGLVLVLRPGERPEPVCLNAGCGGEGQEALVDWEAEERRREAEQRRGAVEELRRITLEQTLLAPHGEAIELCAPDMLETLESVLVPEWDTQTMEHVVLGWQGCIRARLAEELGVSDAEAVEVTRVFGNRHGSLAQRPDSTQVRVAFSGVRAATVQSNLDLRRWVACVAIARSWRDRVHTTDSVMRATDKVIRMGAE